MCLFITVISRCFKLIWSFTKGCRIFKGSQFKLKLLKEMIGWFILNAIIHLGLLLPGSRRNEDICVERKESQQSRTTGCYGPSFGECTSTFQTSRVFSSSCLLYLHPAPLSSLTYCSKQVNKVARECIFFSSSICSYFAERIGVYQSQKLPDHNKCGDSE